MARVTLRGPELNRTPGSVLVTVQTQNALGTGPIENRRYYPQWIDAGASIAAELTTEQPNRTEPSANADKLLECGCEKCLRRWENSI